MSTRQLQQYHHNQSSVDNKSILIIHVISHYEVGVPAMIWGLFQLVANYM